MRVERPAAIGTEAPGRQDTGSAQSKKVRRRAPEEITTAIHSLGVSASATAVKAHTAPTVSAFDVPAYQRDVLERSILFFDTLRKRANAMLEHEQAGLPALLNFKSELILDARHFQPPANYALLRITEVGDRCWDDCVDPEKPPVVVIAPAQGTGPGSAGSSAIPRSALRSMSVIWSIS